MNLHLLWGLFFVCTYEFKGSVDIFHESNPHGPRPHSCDRIKFFYENALSWDIRIFAFNAGINNTRGKLFTDVNDTGDKCYRGQIVAVVVDTSDYVLSLILIDSVTPALNNRR